MSLASIQPGANGFAQLPVDIGGKILGFIKNDPAAMSLARVSHAFRNALHLALWEELGVDEEVLSGPGNESEMLQTTLSPIPLAGPQIKERLLSLASELDAHIDGIFRQKARDMSQILLQNAPQMNADVATVANGLLNTGLFELRASLEKFKGLQKMRIDVYCGLISTSLNLPMRKLLAQKVERISSDLIKARTYSSDDIMRRFALEKLSSMDKAEAESALDTRVFRLLMADLSLSHNIFRYYAQLYQQQKTEACRTPTGRELFQQTLREWGGAFCFERFLDFESIAVKVRKEIENHAHPVAQGQVGIQAVTNISVATDILGVVTLLALDRSHPELNPQPPAGENPLPGAEIQNIQGAPQAQQLPIALHPEREPPIVNVAAAQANAPEPIINPPDDLIFGAQEAQQNIPDANNAEQQRNPRLDFSEILGAVLDGLRAARETLLEWYQITVIAVSNAIGHARRRLGWEG